MTLYGHRRCVLLREGEGAPPEGVGQAVLDKHLVVHSRPGTLYFANLCGAEHFVDHEAAQPAADLFQSSQVGACEVVLIMRSRCFRASRASTAKAGPNPHSVFAAASEAVLQAWSQTTWKLPDREACEKCLHS